MGRLVHYSGALANQRAFREKHVCGTQRNPAQHTMNTVQIESSTKGMRSLKLLIDSIRSLKKRQTDKDKLNKKHYFCSASSCKPHEKTNHSPHSHTGRIIDSLHRKDRLQYNIGTSRLADGLTPGQRTAHAARHINQEPEHKSRPRLPCTAADTGTGLELHPADG